MAYKDREKERAYQRAYYEANREKLREGRRAYYEANRERGRERERAYREQNREKLRERNRAYRERTRRDRRDRRRAQRAALADADPSTALAVPANPTPEQRRAYALAAQERGDGRRNTPRKMRIWELWNEGASQADIAADLGSTTNAISVQISQMRKEGWPLPYRRSSYPRRSV